MLRTSAGPPEEPPADHVPAARVALIRRSLRCPPIPLGRVMDACVISVIGVTLRKRGSDSRTGRRMCPVLRSRAGGTNMLNSYAPFDPRRHHVAGSPPAFAAHESVQPATATRSCA